MANDLGTPPSMAAPGLPAGYDPGTGVLPPTATTDIDFSDLGGKRVDVKPKAQFDFSDLGGSSVPAGASAQLKKQEDDAAVDNEMYNTDPQAFKIKYPVAYRVRKAHDILVNAVTNVAEHDQPESTKKLEDAPLRKVVAGAASLGGLPTGEIYGGIQMSTLPGKPGDFYDLGAESKEPDYTKIQKLGFDDRGKKNEASSDRTVD